MTIGAVSAAQTAVSILNNTNGAGQNAGTGSATSTKETLEQIATTAEAGGESGSSVNITAQVANDSAAGSDTGDSVGTQVELTV